MSSKKPAKKKSLGQRAMLSVGSTVFTLLVLELVFRVMGIRAEFPVVYPDVALLEEGQPLMPVRFGRIPNSILRSTYDSNPRGYFDDGYSGSKYTVGYLLDGRFRHNYSDQRNGINHQFNSVGWRDEEHTVEKPSGTYRILGLGDSFLFGQGVRREDTFFPNVVRHLERKISGRQIEGINTGQTALNTVQENDLLVHRGLDYDPDLVILHFVPNDVEHLVGMPQSGPVVDLADGFRLVYETRDMFSGYWQSWGWARQQYLRYFSARNYIDQSLENYRQDSRKWERCRNALSEMNTVCRDNEISFFVVIFPFFYDLNGNYPFEPIHRAVRSFCNEKQIKFLDLRGHFPGYKGPDLWVHATDQHPNEKAHEIAARAISDFLVDHAPDFGLASPN